MTLAVSRIIHSTVLITTVIVGLIAAGLYLRYSVTVEKDKPPLNLTLYRFFGGCSDRYSGVTDLAKAVGECGIIQVLTNRFNATNDQGAIVHSQSIEWSAYYDRLSAAYATRHPPTIAIMNRSVLPSFVKRGLLLPLKQDLLTAGVAFDDIVPSALDGVVLDGDMYALPFDIHALLWHVNLDLLAQAGLVNAQGEPILPTSPEELVDHARRVREKTGRAYIAIPSQSDPMPVWTFQTWVWQQGSSIVSQDLGSVQLNSPPAHRALQLLQTLYMNGYANPRHDYAGAEQAFLNGDAAILVNGTWVVDGYLAQSHMPGVRLKRYAARTVPVLFNEASAWSDSHVWVLPRPEVSNERQHQAAVSFLKFLFEHSGQWAKTGHLPIRISTLRSQEFLSLPERKGYMDTPAIAHASLPVENHRAIQDALIQEINATWLMPRPTKESLLEAEQHVRRILHRLSR